MVLYLKLGYGQSHKEPCVFRVFDLEGKTVSNAAITVGNS